MSEVPLYRASTNSGDSIDSRDFEREAIAGIGHEGGHESDHEDSHDDGHEGGHGGDHEGEELDDSVRFHC